MLPVYDRVRETTTTTGTGNITLAGADTTYRTFTSVFATGQKFKYSIWNTAANEWEVGVGHLSSSTTLVRDTVESSSNANAAVSFSAGTKVIIHDVTSQTLRDMDTLMLWDLLS